MLIRENTTKSSTSIIISYLIIASLLCVFPTETMLAQSISSENDEGSAFQKIALGISSGSQALIGLDAATNLSRNINLKLGYYFLNFNFAPPDIDASRFGLGKKTLLVDSKLSLNTIGILAEFMPFSSNKLRLVGGLMVGLDDGVEVAMRFKDDFQFNDYLIKAEEIGTINVKYFTETALYPYLGIGFGRSIPDRRVSINLEVGTYLRGRPQFEFSGSGLLEDNEHLAEPLEEALKSWQWHPNASIRIAFRLSRQSNDPDILEENDEFDITPPSREQQVSIPLSEQQESFDTPSRRSENLEEVKANSAYLELNGTVFNQQNGEQVDYIFVNVYKLMDGKPKELIRTGRFMQGTFKIPLEKGHRYEFRLEHHLFQVLENEVDLTNPFVDEKLDLNFTLEPR